MENDTDPSLSLEQSSCDTPCEEKLPASGKPSRSVKYKFQKNDNIEQQKIAILNKVADRIANKEEKGEYSFGKQIGEELIIL